jgi:hypothetical protein
MHTQDSDVRGVIMVDEVHYAYFRSRRKNNWYP